MHNQDSDSLYFLSGYHRANEQLALTVVNKAVVLGTQQEFCRAVCPDKGNADTFYHEARKIVGAELQHITYSHWLPKILGQPGKKMLKDYQATNPNVNAGIITSFATAAFRFGHILINSILCQLKDTFGEIPKGHLPLYKVFFSPFRIIHSFGDYLA